MKSNLAAALALSALICVPAAHAQSPKTPAPSLAEEIDRSLLGPQDAMVAVDGGDDNLLYGSLLRPEGNGGFPTVLILPAQGADRNGNPPGGEGARPDTYKLLARDLAAKGVASLRIDKRGVGASAKAIGREEDLRFSTYVDDAVTWIKFLKAQPMVNCLAVLGHSEGALVAALAAQKIKVCAVIEMSGAARPAAAVLAEQLKVAQATAGMDKDNYDKATVILNSLANGKTVADTPPKLQALFRPSVQPYLISWLTVNPIEPLKTAPPTLVLQGGADRQLDLGDAQKLAAAPKLARMVMIPGADHDLKMKAAGDGPGPLSPQASTVIADFLKRLTFP